MKEETLLEECISALEIAPLSEKESEQISELFEEMFPVAEWGKVNWKKIKKKKTLVYPNHIIPALEQLWGGKIDKSVYIICDVGDLPVIKTNLDNTIKSFHTVEKLGSTTFIFNPTLKYIIEVLSSGDITVGFVN